MFRKKRALSSSSIPRIPRRTFIHGLASLFGAVAIGGATGLLVSCGDENSDDPSKNPSDNYSPSDDDTLSQDDDNDDNDDNNDDNDNDDNNDDTTSPSEPPLISEFDYAFHNPQLTADWGLGFFEARVKDPNGDLKTVQVKINDGEWRDYGSGVREDFPVRFGENGLEVLAKDEEGHECSESLTFDSLNEEDLKLIVRGKLDLAGVHYLADQRIYFGTTPYQVDFLIVGEEGDSIIQCETIRGNGNYENLLIERREFDLYAFPNMYLIGDSKRYAEKFIEEFLSQKSMSSKSKLLSSNDHDSWSVTRLSRNLFNPRTIRNLIKSALERLVA